MKDKHYLFVRWSCGCIGVLPNAHVVREDHYLDVEGSHPEYLIIKACDDDDYMFACRDGDKSLFLRPMPGKSFLPLKEEEQENLLNALADLIRDGKKFRTVKQMLEC